MHNTHNLRVESTMTLSTPEELRSELPMTERAAATVANARAEIEAIIDGRDHRLLVVVGPCSIHDPDAALEYADKLGRLRDRIASDVLVCMRGYFEKPRTTVGWKGLINDPHLDGSCDVRAGLRKARSLLLKLAEMGMPVANEALDPVTPQYLTDLIAWSAIGARTTESQTHREMASGLSTPVGFKNGTDGSLEVAINAMKAAREPHSFIGINGQGVVSLVRTRGNPYSHAVLRGGSQGTNYGEREVAAASERLARAGVNPRVLVDASHGNSEKKHENQPRVTAEVGRQIAAGSRNLLGVMIESHIIAGQQELKPGRPLTYGQSITDACIDFATTERVLTDLAYAVTTPRPLTNPG
jgi:3-deoxy-7-phosphoheptulonate synthase